MGISLQMLRFSGLSVLPKMAGESRFAEAIIRERCASCAVCSTAIRKMNRFPSNPLELVGRSTGIFKNQTTTNYEHTYAGKKHLGGA